MKKKTEHKEEDDHHAFDIDVDQGKDQEPPQLAPPKPGILLEQG